MYVLHIFLWFLISFSSVQFSSVTQSCPTLCNPMNRSTPGLTSMESVMPSSHLILCCPLLLLPPIPPSIRVFSNEWTLHMRWPKYWSFSFSTFLPKNTQGWSPLEQTGWISCSPRDSQESSPTPQFKSINSSALSFHCSPTLTSIHDDWKNHSLD